MSKSLFRLIVIFFVTSVATPVVNAQRETMTINSGWKFAKGETPQAANSHFDDCQWKTIHLPHTWNTDAYTQKEYYRGIGWYRKSLSIPQAWKGRQLYLKFEGASKSAEIYINGRLAGEHRGGYTAFTVDITPYCTFNAPNIIAVRVDNARQDTPPISGDFTFFGGIYRDVWVTSVPKQHFDLNNHGSDGISIQASQVSEKEASLIIKGEVKNDAAKRALLIIENVIYAPCGKMIQTLQKPVTLKAGELYTHHVAATPIRKPRLWTPETPELYRIKTILRNGKTREILDETEHHTGFRWFRFDAEKGFFLNGKPYKLQGICRHQDQKPIGPALSDEMHRRDMLLMKEMGANFIRISHYPQDAAILEQCDKLGMLAWEEIPIIDIVPDSEEYANTCETNLREMIRQHYNHPSIIMWGYMNEILLVTQRKHKTEAELKPVLERTLALAQRLEKVLKEEDPLRVSTMAFHGSNSYNTTGLGSITDIVGWNLYQGWYGGKLSGFDQFLEQQHRDYPMHPMIVSEYGAGSDKRLHSLHPKSFDFSIEYQQKYLEHYLPVIQQTPYISGGTYWNFIDFSSALRDESMPRINNKGLVYADRTPKDVYYYYQAMFRKDTPVLHIASRDWTRRSGVQTGKQPVLQPVKVYTNLPEVELFIDGRSVGRKKTINCHAMFEVPFQKGTHFLRAAGHHNKSLIEDGVSIHFTPVPATLTAQTMAGVELAINVGSNCFYTSDESQLTWLPDQAYQPGGWGYLGGKSTSTNTEIHLTADGPLYQTLRENPEGYRFDVPEGDYEVELLFADVFREGASIAYQLGNNQQQVSQENSFRVLINETAVEDNFSPCRESGYFRAICKRFLVAAKEKKIEIRFEALQGKTLLNGIKLRKL